MNKLTIKSALVHKMFLHMIIIKRRGEKPKEIFVHMFEHHFECLTSCFTKK